jgi:hypothetical protein
MKYIQAIKETLPVFGAFMCGAIAQQVNNADVTLMLKLGVWAGLYMLALFLYERLIRKIRKRGIA